MLCSTGSVLLLAVSTVTAAPRSRYSRQAETWRRASAPDTPVSHCERIASLSRCRNDHQNLKVPRAKETAIEQQAHGLLPNFSPSKQLAKSDITTFELIALNELFEAAFFTSLIFNISHHVPGFEIDSSELRNSVIDNLQIIQAQETLHARSANDILASVGATPIQSCEYSFPTSNFTSAIALARTFTDLGLGTLQAALDGLAVNGDNKYVPLVGSLIGQEGEQNGYYRSLLNLAPSELPFLTRSTASWAFSALHQMFIVPGSCPNAHIIDLPVFHSLIVDTHTSGAITGEVNYSFTNHGTDLSSISLVYLNQQNLPIVEKPQNVESDGDLVTFKAVLPFDAFLMNGLTIAVITNSSGPFTSADEVTQATLYGPGLIEIN